MADDAAAKPPVRAASKSPVRAMRAPALTTCAAFGRIIAAPTTNRPIPPAMSSSSSFAAEALPPYQVRTHNASEQSENRIHSDDIARQFGFKGALVPGVTVFAHMTRPLVEHFGERWLARGVADVTFFKPAYEGDLLTIRTRHSTTGQGYELSCANEAGVELARMSADIASALPAVDPRSDMPPSSQDGERPVVSWELMEIGRPFPALRWAPTPEDNRVWCEDTRDDLALFRSGPSAPIHPGFVLRQANLVLRNRFVLPAWIHTGSRITFRDVPRLGNEYEVRAVPEEKWERKGHQMVRLYVAIRAGAKTYAEVLHTAIFKPHAAK
jgi:hypothetical protein